jgi:hypothetical protein
VARSVERAPEIDEAVDAATSGTADDAAFADDGSGEMDAQSPDATIDDDETLEDDTVTGAGYPVDDPDDEES